MKAAALHGFQKQVYYRLIALWVVCEAFLGGIIHGLKLPVSGLLVGSCAVICICLMAYYIPGRAVILKATVIVVVFKMMLSPQSPLPAYIAVLFQGLVGELLFINRRWFKVSCFLLALLALVESAVQRVLVLTVLYGNSLWKAINVFINGITRQQEVTNYSLLLVGGYILLHILAGIIAGWLVLVVVRRMAEWGSQPQYRLRPFNVASTELPERNQVKKKKLKRGLFVIWVILVLLLLQSWLGIGKPLLPTALPLQLLVRSAVIVLTWYFLASPLIMYFFRKWVKKQEQRSAPDIQQVLLLLPATQYIVRQSWQESAMQKGFGRWKHFGRMVLVNTLYTQYEQ